MARKKPYAVWKFAVDFIAILYMQMFAVIFIVGREIIMHRRS